MIRALLLSSTLALTALGLSACDRKNEKALEKLDESLAGNQADPALSGALGDQIVVDAKNAGQPGGGAPGGLLRAPEPKKAPPPASGEAQGPRAQQRTAIEKAGCTAKFSQANSWAARLPADIPLYPEARVVRAAGSTAPDCTLRQVSFTTGAQLRQVVDFYYTKARRAGFSAEHLLDGGDHVLGGTRERDGGAYHIAIRPAKDGGTEVDLLANNGR